MPCWEFRDFQEQNDPGSYSKPILFRGRYHSLNHSPRASPCPSRWPKHALTREVGNVPLMVHRDIPSGARRGIS